MDRIIATMGGIGWVRPASGTLASAVAILLGVLVHRIGSFPLLALATIAVTIAGFWAVRGYTAGMADKDRPEIVIDEMAGQWIALCAPSAGFWFAGLPPEQFPYPGWLAAFAFFRLFDIWKPWIVGRADAKGTSTSVMEDDIWAGILAALCTIIAAGVAHGLMGR